MHQAATMRLETGLDETAEAAVLGPAHVLEHAHRDERVEPAPKVAIVLFEELHPVLQPAPPRLLPGVADLLPGDVAGAHAHAEALGHVERKGAPAAAGLHD